MSGFSDKKIEYSLLLPVDLDNTKTSPGLKTGYLQPDKITLDIIQKLINRNKIPRTVLVRLIGTGILNNI